MYVGNLSKTMKFKKPVYKPGDAEELFYCTEKGTSMCELCQPPIFLYAAVPHGNLEDIRKEGLKPLGRNFLRLTPKADKAKEVSKCDGDDTIILKIRARDAYEAGEFFWFAPYAINLVRKIDAKYIEENYTSSHSEQSS